MERENTKKVWRKRIVRSLFEFFVVFLGVYLAFLFTDYQEAIQDKKIRIKYHSSLIFEFEVFAQHLEQEEIKLQKLLLLVEQIKQGQKPALTIAELYYLYDGSVVKAAFNDSNFGSLNQGLLQSIIEGTLLLEQLENKILRFNQLQQTLLIPLLTKESGDFYRQDAQLKPVFLWYPKLIQDIEKTNRQLHGIITEKAIPGMEQQKTALENSPYWSI